VSNIYKLNDLNDLKKKTKTEWKKLNQIVKCL